MEEIVYTYCGHAYGQFASDRTGELITYCNVYVIYPITGEQRSDRHFQGYKAEQFKCASPDLLEGFAPEDKIHLYFDPRGRVVKAELVKAK